MHDTALLGIDLGGTQVRVGRVRGQDLVRVEATTIDAGGSVEEVMDQLFGVIDRFDLSGVEGMGIGAPSVVDVEEGVVYDVQNIPSWAEVPVKALLEARYDRPTFVNNDANCFALGEKRYGKGQPYNAMIGLILGTGIAGGVVIGGQLYNGPNAGAGEFGMMPYRDGIYEDYCSGQFFERQYGASGAALYERAEAGEPAAVEAFAAFGTHLGQALKAILYAYDPEAIILGGSVRHAFAHFQEAMWAVLKTFAYTRSLERLTIAVSERAHVAVLGAAALALDAETTQPR